MSAHVSCERHDSMLPGRSPACQETPSRTRWPLFRWRLGSSARDERRVDREHSLNCPPVKGTQSRRSRNRVPARSGSYQLFERTAMQTSFCLLAGRSRNSTAYASRKTLIAPGYLCVTTGVTLGGCRMTRSTEDYVAGPDKGSD